MKSKTEGLWERHFLFLASYTTWKVAETLHKELFCIFCGGLECDVHSFVYVAHFVLLRDVWIGNQRAAVASRRVTNWATHLHNKKSYKPNLLRSRKTSGNCPNFLKFCLFFVLFSLQLFSFEFSERFCVLIPFGAQQVKNGSYNGRQRLHLVAINVLQCHVAYS